MLYISSNQMSDIREAWIKYYLLLYIEEKASKKAQVFHLKDCYFVVGSPIGMSFFVFWETLAGFLKSSFATFPNYSQSYVDLNVKSKPNFSGPQKSRGAALVIFL